MSDKKKNDPHSLKDSIEEFLDKYQLRQSYNLREIKSLWAGLMGQTIAKRTRDIYFRDDKLMVIIESAALKHQLHMQRTKICKNLNQAMGSEYVKEVVIL